MKALSWIVGVGVAGASVVVACGGAANQDLFSGSDGDGGASSSGASSSGASSSGASSSGASSSGASSTSSSSSSSSSGDGGGLGCRPSVPADCMNNEYCDVGATCAAAGGTCRLKPAESDAPMPVCGCDGVTYYNPQLAANRGMSVKTTSPCSASDKSTSTCTNGKCASSGGGSLFCGITASSLATCGTASSVCWALPATCPDGVDRLERACVGGGTSCSSLCEAVRSEKAFYTAAAVACQ